MGKMLLVIVVLFTGQSCGKQADVGLQEELIQNSSKDGSVDIVRAFPPELREPAVGGIWIVGDGD